MAEQNSVNFNSADFTINSGVFDLNDAVAKSVSSDSGSATPSSHAFSIVGSGGVTTSATGSTVTIDGSSVGGGVWVYLASQTASNDSSLDFTSDIDSTYDMYVFEVIAVTPATNSVYFGLRTSTDTGSNFATSGYHVYTQVYESGGGSASYNTNSGDRCVFGTPSDGDGKIKTSSTINGFVYMINPSATRRHFFQHSLVHLVDSGSGSGYIYGVTAQTSTTAVDAIRFLMSSGNISSGTIRLYGISNS